MKDRLRQQHHVGEGQIDFQLCGAVLSPSGQKLSPSFFFMSALTEQLLFSPWNFGWGPYHQNYQGQPNLKHLWRYSILTVKSRAAHTPQNFHEFPLFPVYKQWLLETTEASAVTFADSKSRVGCSCWLFLMILGTGEEQLLSQKGQVHKLFFLPILPSFPLLPAWRGQALWELSLPPVTRQSGHARPITVAASGKTGSFANSDCTFPNSSTTYKITLPQLVRIASLHISSNWERFSPK